MATITSTASGNWTAGGTWVGGIAPISTDDVIIAGHTVTLDSVTITCNTCTFNNASSRLALSGSVTRELIATNGFTVSGVINGALCGTLVTGQSLTLTGLWSATMVTVQNNNRIADSTGGDLTVRTVGDVQSSTLLQWMTIQSCLRICATWSAGALITTGLINTSASTTSTTLVTQSGGSWTHNSVGTNNLVSTSNATSMSLLTQSGTAVFNISGDFNGQVNNAAFITCGGGSGLNYGNGDLHVDPIGTQSGTSYVINHSGTSTTEWTGSFIHHVGAKFYSLAISNGAFLWRSQTVTIPADHDCAIVAMAGSFDVSSLVINNSGNIAIIFTGTASIVASPGASITNQTASAGAAVTGRTGFTIVNVESPTPTLPVEEDVTLGTVYGYTGAELTGTALLVDNTILAAAVTTSLQGIHLHKLFASPYSATTKPGDADGLLNKLMEDAGAGVPRYTAAALVNAGGGGGGATAADIWDYLITSAVTSGSFGVLVKDIYNVLTNVTYGNSALKTLIDSVVATVDSGTYGNSALKTLIDAISTQVSNLNNLSSKTNLFGPTLLEIPDAGSSNFPFTLVVKDDEDKLVDLDSDPTLTAMNAAGADRTANISAITHTAVGRYDFTYSVSSAATEEGLLVRVVGAKGAEARFATLSCSVVNYNSLTIINTILTNLNSLASTSATEANATTNKNSIVSEITSLNNLSSAQAQTAAAAALTAFGATTEANATSNRQAVLNDVGLVKAKTDSLTFTTPNKVDASADVQLSQEDIDAIVAAVGEAAGTVTSVDAAALLQIGEAVRKQFRRS